MDTGKLEQLAVGIQEAALTGGADEAECLVRCVHGLTIEVKGGKPEGVRRTEEVSAALRVLVQGREGFAYTTGPDEGVRQSLARSAVDAARLLPSLVENRFSSSTSMGSRENLYDAEGARKPFEDKVLLASQVEETVLDTDERVKQAHKPSYHEKLRQTVITSGGQTWSYEDSVYSLSVQAVAREGAESQSGYDYAVSRRLSDIQPSDVGRTAAREALELLGGQPPETGSYPALFPPKVALDLLGALVASFSAEEMQKGRSRLADKRGEKLFSEVLNLVDDGTLPWGTGTVPFDDERVPPVPRRLVDGGVVSGCLHTLKTAAKWSEEPTGSAFRGGLASPPSPGPSNLYIMPGEDPMGKILPSGRTVRFSSLMGTHMMDRVTGDFSLGASGYILNNGEEVRPFRNGTVSGNLFVLMAGLEAVGSDLTFYGSMGSPTLLFHSVIISGR